MKLKIQFCAKKSKHDLYKQHLIIQPSCNVLLTYISVIFIDEFHWKILLKREKEKLYHSIII